VAEAKLETMLMVNTQEAIQTAYNDTDYALEANAAMMDSWAVNAAIKAQWAAEEVIRANTAIFNSLMNFGQVENPKAWYGGGDDFDYMAAGADIVAEQEYIQRQAERMRTAMRRSWAADDERAAQVENESAALRSYGGALGYVDTEAQKAAEAHSRFLASFNEELRAKPEDGLYNAEGVANVEAVNKALYEQVEAAGASAATLALLGVATGQFTQEQAEAALKAAVLAGANPRHCRQCGRGRPIHWRRARPVESGAGSARRLQSSRRGRDGRRRRVDCRHRRHLDGRNEP
jgi:hypothetical protein